MPKSAIMGALLVAFFIRLVFSAETVGKAEYIYIGANHYQFQSVATRAIERLESVGFIDGGSVSVDFIGQQRAEDILNAASDYGGVLIYVGHGNTGWVTLEPYEYTIAGFNQATNRMQLLIDAGRLTPSEVTVVPVEVGTQWAHCVALTNPGINSNFGGSNAIAVIGACNSGSTAGNWGARVELVYNYVCTGADVQADLDVLFENLTANGLTDFSKMTVAQAIDGTTLSVGAGNTATALFPWVTAVTPIYSIPWTSPPTQVTMNFGVDMDEIANPFYVGGVGIVRGTNGWLSSTAAAVNVYYGWQLGNVIVGLDAGRIESSRGIPLYNAMADHAETYTCAVSSFPPAASVSAFVPTLTEGGGVAIDVDLMSLRGTDALWVERSDGQLVGDTLRVASLSGHAFTVHDETGSAGSAYHLYERERDGDVFLRASEGVTEQVSVVQSEPNARGLAEALEESVGSGDWNESDPIGIVICPDAFVATAQIYADYWTNLGRPVDVAPLSVTGATRTAIRSYIEQRHAEGVRYVLLAGSASDHEWFDDPAKWPDLPGTDDWYYWYQDYHTPGGYYDFESRPEQDLIATWYLSDAAYDNMSYWTPYYAADFLYRIGLAGLRVGRVPASTNARFLAWISKNIDYCDDNSEPWSADVGIWGQCHSWDGNSGPMMQVLIQDLRNQLPGALNQHALVDTVWTQAQRQAYAVDAWNSGRGIVYMLGTSSTAYKPIHFFAKSAGWNVGMLSPGRFPVVVGASCGIGTHDMAIDPTYGDQFAIELLTGSSTSGSPFMIGPSRGTWAEGNRQMVERLNKHMSTTPALDIGTAFMLAQDDVVGSSPSEAVQTAISYQLLGDPLAPLPGTTPTSIADRRPARKEFLLRTYPNPFNPAAVIVYALPRGDHVSLRVYDVAGRLVATLVDEVRSAGPHRIEWRPRGVASGVYFCRLQVGSRSMTQKMTLLK